MPKLWIPVYIWRYGRLLSGKPGLNSAQSILTASNFWRYCPATRTLFVISRQPVISFTETKLSRPVALARQSPPTTFSSKGENERDSHLAQIQNTIWPDSLDCRRRLDRKSTRLNSSHVK